MKLSVNPNNKAKVYVDPNTYETICIFDNYEDISGEICITPYESTFEHNGVKVEIIGEIKSHFDNTAHEFESIHKTILDKGIYLLLMYCYINLNLMFYAISTF